MPYLYKEMWYGFALFSWPVEVSEIKISDLIPISEQRNLADNHTPERLQTWYASF